MLRGQFEDLGLAPGNYALVFHPNTPDDEGMSLEVRKIPPGEFLKPGNVMTQTPEGETLWRGPIAFDVEGETVPALQVKLLQADGGVTVDVRYGNRRTKAVFAR